jgi:SulP family sulfate permease
MRIDGSLFFGSVNHLQDRFERLRHESPQQKHLAIVCDGINFVDLQGGHALADEATRRQRNGGGLYLLKVKGGLWQALERCGCLDNASARNVFQSKHAAIHGIFQKLDKQICAQCNKRIFSECQEVPVTAEAEKAR